MNILKMGQAYRYSRQYNHGEEIIHNLPNYFYHTYTPGEKYALLDSGINPVMSITDREGSERRPAILISSSPHKVGSTETPWQDYFDPDNGHIRYYGGQ